MRAGYRSASRCSLLCLPSYEAGDELGQLLLPLALLQGFRGVELPMMVKPVNQLGGIVGTVNAWQCGHPSCRAELVIAVAFTLLGIAGHHHQWFAVFECRQHAAHAGVRQHQCAVVGQGPKFTIVEKRFCLDMTGAVISSANLADDVDVGIFCRPAINDPDQAIEGCLCASGQEDQAHRTAPRYSTPVIRLRSGHCDRVVVAT